jgi:serine/threonine-protein kinase HipA
MLKAVHKVDVFLNDKAVGVIALTDDNLCAFEYTSQYLLSGVSISPFYLPLQSGVIIAKREPFNGVFGIFNDSLPDGWGKLLTDRLLTKQNIALSEVSILNRMCLLGNNCVGALNYKPQHDIINHDSVQDLNVLAKEVEQILQNNYEGDLESLFMQGGSSGGARPKVFIKKNDINWIVKFKASSDPEYIGELEYNYSLAARKCGLEMPETHLFEGKYFGVKRFDIEGQKKYHVHSASGLLYASYRYPSIDYTDLIKTTLALTQNMQEALKLFQQMVFNVLTYNRDDHAKNFSYLLKNNTWSLSPSYDLVFSHGFNGEHTTTINDKGIPDKDDIFEVAAQTGMPTKQIKLIYDDVNENSKDLVKELKTRRLI